MATPALASVDWVAAAARVEPVDAIGGASLRSLAALSADDFEDGLQLVRQARQSDPFNPIHDLRQALLHARFGDLDNANETLQRLQRYDLPAPIIPYLRALFALRGGRADQARSIAASVETTHPDFLPAKFLRAEAQIVMTSRVATIERYLRGLPTGEEWQPSWTDLLVKLVLLHPDEGPALAARYQDKRISPDSPMREVLAKAVAWSGASIEQLFEQLSLEPADSRGEAVLLGTLVERLERMALDSEESEGAVRMLRAQTERHPERTALRHVFNGFQTGHAAKLAADERYEEALRFAERSLRDAPHDLIHYQNRAALFTLMREPEAYYEAWAALNAHQYRLVLLGLKEQVIGHIIKTHRLFAQQFRGGAERFGRGSVFQLIPIDDGGAREVVNGAAIASDPDILRQWFHHKRAELVFRHLAIGTDGRRVLLEPVDRDEALARVEALKSLSASLGVLTPEEGNALRDALNRHWAACALDVRTRYEDPAAGAGETAAKAGEGEPKAAGTEPPPDDAVRELKEEHLAALADLCLICLQWQPHHDHLWIAEEILDWTREAIAFVDVELLARLERDQGHKLPYAQTVFAARLRLERGQGSLADLAADDCRAAAESCMALLLVEMGYAAHSGFGGTRKAGAAQAMEYVHRARAFRPANADVELAAAELLAGGEFFDDARKALARFRCLVEPDNQYALDRAERLDNALDQHRTEGATGHKYEREADPDFADTGDAERVSELLADIDSAPNSWRLYASLVRELVLGDRVDEAIVWADRCVARCLGRSEQVSARELAIETRGLKALMAVNPRSAKLYAVGAYDAARRALEALTAREGPTDFALRYLLGQCQLNAGHPDAANASFRAAFEACEKPIYRSVLQRLTNDIDHAYLTVARNAIDARVRAGDYDEAVAGACEVFGRLKSPEAWLVDIARVLYSVALGRAQAESGGSPIPGFDLEADWRGRLDQALAAPSDVERALAVADLAGVLHPHSAQRAQLIVERALALRQRLASVAALKAAGQMLTELKFEQTLALLADLDPAIAAEPRLRRLRILALLGTHRFREADEAVAHFGETNSAELKDFLASYPSFAFRQRIALVQGMLREGKAQEALELLRNLSPPGPEEEVDFAYCRAFATTLEGYAARKRGDPGGARERFGQALLLLEPHAGRPGTPPHVAELFDRLDMEADQHVG